MLLLILFLVTSVSGTYENVDFNEWQHFHDNMVQNAVEIDNNHNLHLHDHQLNVVHDTGNYHEVGWGAPDQYSAPIYDDSA